MEKGVVVPMEKQIALRGQIGAEVFLQGQPRPQFAQPIAPDSRFLAAIGIKGRIAIAAFYPRGHGSRIGGVQIDEGFQLFRLVGFETFRLTLQADMGADRRQDGGAERGQILLRDEEPAGALAGGGDPVGHMGGVGFSAAEEAAAVEHIEAASGSLEREGIRRAQAQAVPPLGGAHFDGQRGIAVYEPQGMWFAPYPHIEIPPGVQFKEAIESAGRKGKLLPDFGRCAVSAAACWRTRRSPYSRCRKASRGPGGR